MRFFEVLEIKNFMNALLTSEAFDEFLFLEGQIKTKLTVDLDGEVISDYFTSEEQKANAFEKYLPYREVRGNCFNLIKGKKQPLSFCFVLLANQRLIEQLCEENEGSIRPSDIANLSFVIRFSNAKLTLQSACTLRGFSLDKSIEQKWDEYVTNYLKQNNFAFDILV